MSLFQSIMNFIRPESVEELAALQENRAYDRQLVDNKLDELVTHAHRMKSASEEFIVVAGEVKRKAKGRQ